MLVLQGASGINLLIYSRLVISKLHGSLSEICDLFAKQHEWNCFPTYITSLPGLDHIESACTTGLMPTQA